MTFQISGESLAIPAVDSANNNTLADVIGNKNDTYLGDSLYALMVKDAALVTARRQVYPTLAAGAAIVSANANWAYGNYAVIVPAGIITGGYHVLAISIESCNRNAVFELQLYQGAADDVVTTVRFAVVGGFFGNQVYVIGSAEIVAGAQIRARLASSNGLAEIATITLSLVYWEFV